MNYKIISACLALVLMLSLLAGCGTQEPIEPPTFPNFSNQGQQIEPSGEVVYCGS